MNNFLTVDQKIELIKIASTQGQQNGLFNDVDKTVKNYDTLVEAIKKTQSNNMLVTNISDYKKLVTDFTEAYTNLMEFEPKAN